MAICSKCGAELQDGVKFCGECGARVDSEATDPVRLATVSPAEEQPEIPQPAQPVWAQFAGQTQGQTVPPTFFVPRRLGKGGGVAMIIIGSVMITYFLFFAVAVIAQAIDSRSGVEDLAPVLILLVLTLLAGGLLLLLFGIRKIKNVNRYNANL